ncbi:hypothetical protein [Fibrella aestuarina]|nr:hypothetical protein [Fibrella aestuarina]
MLKPEVRLLTMVYETADRQTYRELMPPHWVEMDYAFGGRFEYGAVFQIECREKPEDSGTYVVANLPFLSSTRSPFVDGNSSPMQMTLYLAREELFAQMSAIAPSPDSPE